jgi:hypothetical protein
MDIHHSRAMLAHNWQETKIILAAILDILQGVLVLCEFHYCDFSKHSISIWLMRILGYIISLLQFFGYFFRKNCTNEIK